MSKDIGAMQLEITKTEKKQDVVYEVTEQIDSFYKSVDLSQARVRDQIQAKYNVYQRLASPTPEEIEYMVEVDSVTDYTTELFDSLNTASGEIDALETIQEVEEYTYAMPPSGQINPIGELAFILRIMSMGDI